MVLKKEKKKKNIQQWTIIFLKLGILYSIMKLKTRTKPKKEKRNFAIRA